MWLLIRVFLCMAIEELRKPVWVLQPLPYIVHSNYGNNLYWTCKNDLDIDNGQYISSRFLQSKPEYLF